MGSLQRKRETERARESANKKCQSYWLTSFRADIFIKQLSVLLLECYLLCVKLILKVIILYSTLIIDVTLCSLLSQLKIEHFQEVYVTYSMAQNEVTNVLCVHT